MDTQPLGERDMTRAVSAVRLFGQRLYVPNLKPAVAHIHGLGVMRQLIGAKVNATGPGMS